MVNFWSTDVVLKFTFDNFRILFQSFTYFTDKWSASNIYKFRASGRDRCRSKTWTLPLLSQHELNYSSKFAIGHMASTSSFCTCPPWKRVTKSSPCDLCNIIGVKTCIYFFVFVHLNSLKMLSYFPRLTI